MYRILVADDEGIMLESLKSIINRQFPDCEVETAKSGREAIEQAEFFHPDIIFMDIHMPGINGIQALREIRRFNQTALLYVISAYDKFDYAKEAIDLGVERYIMKPITRKTVVSIIEDASAKVEQMRRSRQNQLMIQEKLETVIPVVESGFISQMLIGSDWRDAQYYKQLLDIPEEHGYVLLFRFASPHRNDETITPVGLSVQAQDFYQEFRAIVKSFVRCIVGSVMTDRIVVVVPHREEKLGYEERIRVIEQARSICTRLEERLHLTFRAGIGRVRLLSELRISYQEANRALDESTSHVVHTNDIVSHGELEDDFPIDLEKELFQMLSKGDVDRMRLLANRFFDWMVEHYPQLRDNIRLKVLEFVLEAEKDAFYEGALNYRFELRENYLSDVMAMTDYENLRDWFLEKMTQVCSGIHHRKEHQSESVVARARAYMQENYGSDISLDDVSREVNVSPYYFSKLFKDESGENFIEYLTRLRIGQARKLLLESDKSVKEISLLVGYMDPNYFSRIFKKQTGMTPREFREAEQEGAR